MARIMHIRSQLQNLKKGALSITEFVVKMKGIVDSLTAAGKIITEIDLVAYILGGLGQEFDPVIATITAKKEDITLQEAQFLLMSFEARLEQFTSHTTLEFPAASANVLHRIHKGELPENFLREAQNFRGRFRGRGRGRGGRFSNHRPTCQLCGKTGHFATVCYHRYDQSTGHFGRQQESSLPLQANIAQHCGDYSISPYQKQHVTSFSTPTYLKQPVPYPPASTYPQQVTHPSTPVYQAPSTDMNALIATSSTVQDPHWYIDSGATNHITSDIGNLSLHSSAYKRNESLAVGNGQTLPISHIGNSYFPSFTSSHLAILLNHILFLPTITKNLLSISQLLKDNNLIVQFVDQCCLIKDKFSNQVLLQGTLKDGLYQLPLHLTRSSLEVKSSVPTVNSKFSYLSSTIPIHMSQFHFLHQPQCNTFTVQSGLLPAPKQQLVNTWHNKLGHPSFDVLSTVLHSLNIDVAKFPNQVFCDACQLGKGHKLSFTHTSSRVTAPLELVCSDVWGPAPIPSSQGYRYYVSFIDQFSRFCWIFPLTLKSQVKSIFLQFHKSVECQFNTKLKCLQSDNGGEFRALQSYLVSHGIHHRFSCPYVHQQNGLAEHKHRSIVEVGLSFLAQAKLPLHFWWEAFHTAVFTINRLPTPVLHQKSPFSVLFNKHQIISSLRYLVVLVFLILGIITNTSLTFILSNAYS
ncbi:hypothetical protein ACOSP7_003064 [Xanthoceras sorbifolium]